MSLIVVKFGGTSVADIPRIQSVALKIRREVYKGNKVAVVVSAMAGVTNQLVSWVREASEVYDPKEYDVVVSSGEQVVCGLLALALQEINVPARSWLSWQLPIQTNGAHSKSRIEGIDPQAILTSLNQGVVAVVAGFQGLSQDNRITTLGRGGSDTTAVALASALKADRCDIYTDVDGVYTADPRIVPKAQKLEEITYQEMLELASLGAKVLQTRSVELAMKHDVNLRVLSSFQDGPGTMIVGERKTVEKHIVSGIVCSRDENQITLKASNLGPDFHSKLFHVLSTAHITTDMILHTPDALSFTVIKADTQRLQQELTQHFTKEEIQSVHVDDGICKVSIVGVGIKSDAQVCKMFFDALSSKNIAIKGMVTSEVKISVLMEDAYGELAVRTLHKAFQLEAPQNEAA